MVVSNAIPVARLDCLLTAPDRHTMGLFAKSWIDGNQDELLSLLG
jgi:hypothetical protein